MNRQSSNMGSEKVLCIRRTPLHEVVTMPGRSGSTGAAPRMRAGSPLFEEHRSSTVVTMRRPAAHRAAVVEMPARSEETSEMRPSERERRPTNSALTLGEGLRMTLVALLALLGWPRPTHGNDPGAAAARPFKLELVNAISGTWIAVPSSAGMAARGALSECPRALGGKIGGLARVA